MNILKEWLPLVISLFTVLVIFGQLSFGIFDAWLGKHIVDPKLVPIEREIAELKQHSTDNEEKHTVMQGEIATLKATLHHVDEHVDLMDNRIYEHVTGIATEGTHGHEKDP